MSAATAATAATARDADVRDGTGSDRRGGEREDDPDERRAVDETSRSTVVDDRDRGPTAGRRRVTVDADAGDASRGRRSMRIVLRDDVENLGKKGDLVDVADGYARNYLVPRGLAMKATRGRGRSRPRRCAATARRVKCATVEAAQALAPQSRGRARSRSKARAGEGGKLFGSVTAADIAAAVQEQTGVEIDRRKVDARRADSGAGGRSRCGVRLHAGVEATVGVDVVSE